MPHTTPNILLVDDEAAIRELYTLYFNMQGFNVTTASSAIQTLDEIYKRPYQAVLLDLGLGDSNGLDLIEPVKIAQPNVPIVIFTGMVIDNEIRKEVVERGASTILRKNFPLNYVIDEVKRVIKAAATVG